MPSLGLVANVYNEVNALPGWLEAHLPFFDDVRVYHAGPQGAFSDDGTIELLERWKVPVEFGSIDKGFGHTRTQAVLWSPCEYVMILDADERFRSVAPTLQCDGKPTPQVDVDWILQSYDFYGTNLPNWENVAKLGSGLRVTVTGVQDQGAALRRALESRPDAVATVRRHWHGVGLDRPTQDWRVHPDWQLRVVRRGMQYDTSTRMHERLLGAERVHRAENLYFDHHHFHFKRMEVEQRRHDIRIYDAIHKGERPPKWNELQ